MWLQKLGGGGVCGLAYSPDGGTLFTRDRGGWLTAWDVVARTGRRLFQLGAGGERYYQTGLFVAGDRFLAAYTYNSARVWDLSADALHPGVPADLCYGIPFPPAGTTVRFIAPDRHGIDSYDLASGATARLFAAPSDLNELVIADVSPDGRTAVMIDTAWRGVLLRADGSRADLDKIPYGRVRFSPGGDRLIWTGSGPIHIWDVATRTAVAQVNCFMSEWAFEYHPAAPMFAAANPDRQLTLFSADTGHAIRSLDFALGNYVKCVTFSPDGLTCAVGGSNRQFAVFDVDI